jgi:glycopeptide antibiotics resistance protein
MKRWQVIILSSYSLLVLWVLLFKFSLSPEAIIKSAINGENRLINWVPFMASGGTREIVLNTLVFVPFGVLISMRETRYQGLKVLRYSFLFSLAIEISQYLLAIGATDMTDLLTNTLGGYSGFLLYGLLAKIFPKKILDPLLLSIGTVAVCAFVFLIIITFKVNHVQLNSF